MEILSLIGKLWVQDYIGKGFIFGNIILILWYYGDFSG